MWGLIKFKWTINIFKVDFGEGFIYRLCASIKEESDIHKNVIQINKVYRKWSLTHRYFDVTTWRMIEVATCPETSTFDELAQIFPQDFKKYPFHFLCKLTILRIEHTFVLMHLLLALVRLFLNSFVINVSYWRCCT